MVILSPVIRKAVIMWLSVLAQCLLIDRNQWNGYITPVKRARALQVSLQQLALFLAFHKRQVHYGQAILEILTIAPAGPTIAALMIFLLIANIR